MMGCNSSMHKTGRQATCEITEKSPVSCEGNKGRKNGSKHTMKDTLCPVTTHSDPFMTIQTTSDTQECTDQLHSILLYLR
jgi:hypothetical protein